MLLRLWGCDMALTNLFKISSTDLTKYEDMEKHSVNRQDIFTAWTDGNHIEHRTVSRTQITGTVYLKFPRVTDYSTFLTLLQTAVTADGYYNITVYCSNTGTTETIEAFLDIVSETKWDLSTPMKYHGVTLQITQR